MYPFSLVPIKLKKKKKRAEQGIHYAQFSKIPEPQSLWVAPKTSLFNVQSCSVLNEMSIFSSLSCDQNSNAKTMFFIHYAFKCLEKHSSPPPSMMGQIVNNVSVLWVVFFKQWHSRQFSMWVSLFGPHESVKETLLTVAIFQMSKLRLGEVV